MEENNEFDPIDDLIETLNLARRDYYKLYNKNFKVASIRLRRKLEYVIQASKQMKRDALNYRKQIELDGSAQIEPEDENI